MIEKKPVLCPCCSGHLYENCCERFHQGCLPENALQLMRSRFSAYALNLSDYIILTTHPIHPNSTDDLSAWKQSLSNFSKNTRFQKLIIHEFKENGTMASVTFTAFLTQNGSDATFTEKSEFEKINHRWLYKSGAITKGQRS